MIIKKLTVCDLGSISKLTLRLADGLNVLRRAETDELALAVLTVTNSKSTPFLPRAQIRRESRIEAETLLNGGNFFIKAVANRSLNGFLLRVYDREGRNVTSEYLYSVSRFEEQEGAEYFIGSDRSETAELLAGYDPATAREGLLGINAFRAYLSSFISDFRPERLRAGKKYELVLDKNGKYRVRHPVFGDSEHSLSQSEQIMFRYLCFLRTAEFWCGFEELRNLHSVKKPLIIKDLLERLDESVNTEELMRRTEKLRRQVIILSCR